jgi:hypothetical protein
MNPFSVKSDDIYTLAIYTAYPQRGRLDSTLAYTALPELTQTGRKLALCITVELKIGVVAYFDDAARRRQNVGVTLHVPGSSCHQKRVDFLAIAFVRVSKHLRNSCLEARSMQVGMQTLTFSISSNVPVHLQLRDEVERVSNPCTDDQKYKQLHAYAQLAVALLALHIKLLA